MRKIEPLSDPLLGKKREQQVPSFLRRGNRAGLGQRRELRKNLTSAERKLWSKLRTKQMAGFKFRRQHQIGKFIVDFYCPGLCLIIEVDGNVHVDPQKIKADRMRQRELERRGFTVVRYNNNEVIWNTGGVLQDILENCANLSLTLSLRRRGRKDSPPFQGGD